MFKTKEGITNFIYSFGASIVILGALFKYKRKNKEIRDIYIEITGEIQYE